MHLRSNQVCAQIASIPLMRLAPVTMSQKLNSATAQGNSQGGEQTRVTTNTSPARVANSPTQLTNIFMGITISLSFTVQHRQKEKEYRQKLHELRNKEKTKIEDAESLWKRLDELELQEELEEELDR